MVKNDNYYVLYKSRLTLLIRRFVAFSVDTIILVILGVFIGGGVLSFAFANITIINNFISQSPFPFVMYNIIIYIIYYTWFISGNQQSTPGQGLMNIYVSSLDGKKISKSLAFYRTLFHFPIALISLNYLFVFWRTGYVLNIISVVIIVAWHGIALISNNNQTIHDMLFKTRVIKENI